MTTATSGTGTITLGVAVSGFLTFSGAGVADGNVVSYGIKDGANSETGTGTYTAAGTTLTRTVRKSTNSNTAISLSGSAEVFLTPGAEDILSITETQTANTIFSGPTSGGAAAPAFRALVPADIPANAGWTLLATLTASASATLDDTTSISSTYDEYMIVYRNLLPATNNAGLLMRVSEDGGSTYKATTYDSMVWGCLISGSSGTGNSGGGETEGTGYLLSGKNVTLDGVSNTAGYGVSGNFILHNPNSTTTRKMVTGSMSFLSGGTARREIGVIGGHYDGDNGAVNAIRFLFNSGNITSGTVKIYGIKTS